MFVMSRRKVINLSHNDIPFLFIQIAIIRTIPKTLVFLLNISIKMMRKVIENQKNKLKVNLQYCLRSSTLVG